MRLSELLLKTASDMEELANELERDMLTDNAISRFKEAGLIGDDEADSMYERLSGLSPDQIRSSTELINGVVGRKSASLGSNITEGGGQAIESKEDRLRNWDQRYLNGPFTQD